MPRDEIDLESIPRYKNSASQNLEADRQVQKKNDNLYAKSSQQKYVKHEEELKGKNTFFTKSKVSNINEQDLQAQEERIKEKFTKTGLNNNEEEDFCQKCPTNKIHCPHKNKKEQIKDKYSYPIVSSSTYGWLPPVDGLLGNNHNLNSVTKEFYNTSHL